MSDKAGNMFILLEACLDFSKHIRKEIWSFKHEYADGSIPGFPQICSKLHIEL